ncbi:MAG: type sorting protein [Flaviaesturariibacter sp.]|nr:type sorting protein [Flaviaesturariibacter sp.]
MKKLLLTCLILACACFAFGQTTYYWVGGAPVGPANVTTAANWNTALDGSGSTRPSSTGATDILVFNGANTGGSTPTTGIDSVNLNGSLTCAQMKFVNSASIVFIRSTTGTSTITINGDAGEDFVIEAGSSLTLASTTGSTIIAMAATCTGRVSGAFNMLTTLQARIANTTGGSPNSLIFTAGSTFRTNITATSAAYAFGNNSQSSEKWVTFQSGSTLYYEGGYSPMGSSAAFMPVDFRSGSNFVMRVSNPVGSGGSFFNRKFYANITVENGATLTADGPIYRIDTLTVASGGSMVLHTSGQTVVLGDVVVHGSLSAGATSTNELMFGGSVLQSISGSGTLSVPSLMVGSTSTVRLNRNVSVSKSAVVYGSLDLGTSQLTGAGTFTAAGPTAIGPVNGTLVNGSSFLTVPLGTLTNASRGLAISGTGIAPNTSIVTYYNFPGGLVDTIYLSKPVTASGSNVALALSSGGATLATANANGFDPATGSIVVADVKTYQPGISYLINASTTSPFGITTGSAASISARNITLNAPVTTNATSTISGTLQLAGGRATIRPVDSVRLLAGAVLAGTFGATQYFVIGTDGAGNQGVLRRDGIIGATIFPVGSAANYLPAAVSPAVASDFTVSVFEGITADGTPNGTVFTSAQKQTVVNAVWTINRPNGSSTSDVTLQWTNALEGSTFTTFANSEIGIITNTSGTWSAPIGTGDNTANTATSNFSTFGKFSLGARPPANPFLFNPIPAKTYGDPDFSAGVISANTTMPITYTSSNLAVATIVAGQIHIVGVGTSVITASQSSDGFNPAATISRTLTVNKAPLTIKADDKTKPEGDPNPALTVTYTGFVSGETASVLATPVTVSTTATSSSATGTYPIVPAGATAANYAITFVNGVMTVSPRSTQTITFNPIVPKTYGAADFLPGATSSNPATPVTYVSSNPLVATIVNGRIHIVGAGTASITASQAGSLLFFPAPDVPQTLTVNKASLTIRAVDTTRMQGEPNPVFRLVYTGFVNGEGLSVLSTQPTATTAAGSNAAPGYYPIVVDGAVAANYNVSYTNGRLTVFPSTGTTQPNLQAFRTAADQLRVRVFMSQPDLAEVILYDWSGRLVARKNLFLPAGFISTDLPLNALPGGLYVIRVVGKTIDLKKTISFTN